MASSNRFLALLITPCVMMSIGCGDDDIATRAGLDASAIEDAPARSVPDVTSIDDDGPAPPALDEEDINYIQQRLATAVHDLEVALTEPTPGRHESVRMYQKRAARLRAWKETLLRAGAPDPGLQPGRGEPPASVKALAEATERRIADLAAAAEELTLRGSIASYEAKARVDWEVERLKSLAELIRVPSSEIPSNLLVLVDKPALKSLHKRWKATDRALKVAAASAPVGTYEHALAQSAAKLAAIREAIDAPGVDLAARFFHAARDNIPERSLEPWFAAGEAAARARAIRDREISSLRIALARDGTDVAVRMRLRELDADRDAIHQRKWRHHTMVRSLGFRLADASRTVRDIIKNRFADPLAAVRAEAVLRFDWQRLDLADISFTDWMMRHLSMEDLVEAKAYLEEARRELKAVDLRVPSVLQARLDVDRGVIEAEAAALERELEYRLSGRGARPPLGPASWAPGEMRTDPFALDAPRELRQSFWEALRQYEARTRPLPEAKRMLIQLEFSGYSDEVAFLERDSKKLLDLKGGLADKAIRLLADRAERLQEGLTRSDAYKVNPERALELLKRIRKAGPKVVTAETSAVAPPGRRSPAATVERGQRGIARPYADAALLSLANDFQTVSQEASDRAAHSNELKDLERKLRSRQSFLKTVERIYLDSNGFHNLSEAKKIQSVVREIDVVLAHAGRLQMALERETSETGPLIAKAKAVKRAGEAILDRSSHPWAGEQSSGRGLWYIDFPPGSPRKPPGRYGSGGGPYTPPRTPKPTRPPYRPRPFR